MFLIFAAEMALEIRCNFQKSFVFDRDNALEPAFLCNVFNHKIPQDSKLSFVQQNQSYVKHEEVTAVTFKYCIIPRFPRDLELHFKNMHYLIIENCRVQAIEKDDLKGLENLTRLSLYDNELESLPSDLFHHTKELRFISFAKNKLKSIGSELLDNFTVLHEANFSANPGIDLFKKNDQKIDEFLKIFKEKCKEMEVFENENDKIKDLRTQIDTLKSENIRLTASNSKGGFFQDILAYIGNESTKDFAFKIDNEDFKVHKFVFAARSKTFRKILANNPHTNNLELSDISKEVFKEIMSFVYFDKQPSESTDARKMFIVASKLEIAKLREVSAEKLMKTINSQNLLEILKLAIKYNHQELKLKAFGEIKKVFPTADSQIVDQPEKLEKLMEAFRAFQALNF